MCGIAGLWTREQPIDERMLRGMGDRIVHRGPDHQGIHIDATHRVGLLNQRLSILDLDPRANQPVVSADGRYAMVFNGEIYNYRELRGELEARGMHFRTSGDTEVLLACYSAYGKACLQRLNGMFAFAILDRVSGELFIARDRLGEKPLYYFHGSGVFAFASDLKAFAACAAVPKKIRRQSVVEYLFYEVIPQPYSIYEGVLKLLPGHHLTLAPDGRLTIDRYWDLDLDAEPLADTPDLPERFREVLRRSVDLRLRSDAKVGVFLSGGLDSSAIASQMGRDYPAYTIGFRHASNTLDVDRSRMLAAHFGLQHHVETIDADDLEHFMSFIDVLDEPIAITSMVPLVANYRIARDAGVRVVLSGDGADEIFGGYNDFPQLLALASTTGVQRALARPGIALGRLLLAGFPATTKPGKVRDLYLKPWTALLDIDSPPARQCFMSSTRDLKGLRMLVGQDCALPGDESIEAAYAGRPANLQTMLAAQVKSPLVNRNFAKVDKTSMANSVEARVPFMDHELVEFVFRLPAHCRSGKALLKDSMRGVLPEKILTDRKRGFNLPLQHWIQRYMLPDLDRYLRGGRLQALGVFAPGGIEELVRTIRNPREYHPKMLWNLVILSRWLEGNAWTA